jgi:class 3 adenylate cyclase
MDDFAQVDDTANCFVPEMLVEFIDKRLQQGQEGIEPASFFINGVCLLVDISGFTKLSGDFCEMGKSGIDELQLATNGYMGKLVEIIYTFGGEIIKFAGDAIICVFSASFITAVEEPKKKGGRARRSVYDIKGLNLAGIDENAEDGSPIKSPHQLKSPPSFALSHKPLPNVPAEVVLRAMHCAAVLREVQTEKLSVHVAMSCGEMCFGILGGVENRWECLISGPCIHQLSDCLDDAPSKTAVISPECAAILRNSTLRNSVAQMDLELGEHPDTVHKSFMNTRNGRYEFELTVLPSGNQRIVTVTCIESANKLETSGSKSLTARSSPQLSGMIRQFVPLPIADGLDNAAGLSYLAEIREVTTMFMKVRAFLISFPRSSPGMFWAVLADFSPCFYLTFSPCCCSGTPTTRTASTVTSSSCRTASTKPSVSYTPRARTCVSFWWTTKAAF